jgi:hypothetical protein
MCPPDPAGDLPYADSPTIRIHSMSRLLRGLAAGYGAKKLGGGCITTVLVFIVLWMILGNFDIFR